MVGFSSAAFIVNDTLASTAEFKSPMSTHDSLKTLGVDLDGTLLATDALWESMLGLLKNKPMMVLYFPMWILKGKAFFKHQVARQVELNPALLPYRNEVLSFLKLEKQSGTELVLASASDERIVKRVADHLGLFLLS